MRRLRAKGAQSCMENNKKPVTPEELKLMKGEMKQLLASVRDYLLNMELPSSEPDTSPAALDDGETQPGKDEVT